MKGKYKNLLISIVLGISITLAIIIIFICLDSAQKIGTLSNEIGQEKQKLGY